jgi:hypothetical protein
MSVGKDIFAIDDFRYTLKKKPSDFFALPSVTNFIGQVRADRDPTSISALSIPPFGMGYAPTAEISIDGISLKACNTEVKYTWYPDRIERCSIYKGLKIISTMIMPKGMMGLVEKIVIQNRNNLRQVHRISFRMNGRVKKTNEWGSLIPENVQSRISVSKSKNGYGFVFRSLQEKSVCSQLFTLEPDELDVVSPGPSIYYDLNIGSGKSWECSLGIAYGKSYGESSYDCIKYTSAKSLFAENRTWWDNIFKSAFEQENQNFSGYLPVLETKNQELRRIYYTSILTVIYQHRIIPWGKIKNSYITLSPNAWVTTIFLWDLSLSASLLNQLDPDVFSDMIERFLSVDLHKWFGLDYITGNAVGYWYSSNDYSMFEALMEILKKCKKTPIEHSIRGNNMLNLLTERAIAFRTRLNNAKDEIPDYGDIDNNLECVSSYKHGVPALVGANAYMLRIVAKLEKEFGDVKKSNGLNDLSNKIISSMLRELNVPETGYWRCKQNGPYYIDVRHVYDFMTIGKLLYESIPKQKINMMLEFFKNELLTKTWMHALSPLDKDVIYSERPDHQSKGAYVAWPSESVMALIKMKDYSTAMKIISLISDASLQGLYGQAYYAEGEEDTGGAKKAPFETTWNDSYALAAGNYYKMIVEGLFGEHLSDVFEVEFDPIVFKLDSSAKLKNYYIKGRIFDVDAYGQIYRK